MNKQILHWQINPSSVSRQQVESLMSLVLLSNLQLFPLCLHLFLNPSCLMCAQGHVALQRARVRVCASLRESADVRSRRQLLGIQTEAPEKNKKIKTRNKLKNNHRRLTSPIIADLCFVSQLSALHSSHSFSSSAVIISDSC